MNNNGRLIAAAIVVAGGTIASGDRDVGWFVLAVGAILFLIEYFPWGKPRG